MAALGIKGEGEPVLGPSLRVSGMRSSNSGVALTGQPGELGKKVHLFVSNLPLSSNYVTESPEISKIHRGNAASFRSKLLVGINLLILTLAALIVWKLIKGMSLASAPVERPQVHLRAMPVPAKGPVRIIETAVAVANIRSEPALTGVVVGSLKKGDRVRTEAAGSQWKKVYEVAANGTEAGRYLGFVYSNLLERQASAERGVSR